MKKIKTCPVKLLSKAVTSVLKVMNKQIETYNPYIITFQGLNRFCQYKTTSLVLMQLKNLTVELKHCQ